ncbi:hypothetical protein ACT29H_04400 [Thermophagus sp. OGC60D27]|uniref:hypothetical protein n=1 Tax=Thermophagus sp. OGC60D27 TaxID=3458415 RepID=UPI0040383512
MKSFRLFLVFCLSPLVCLAGEIELRGTYQGDNLYVKNPYVDSGVGFCVYEVMVNGMTTTDEINSSSFEIDLTRYNFAIGAPVHIVLKHKDGCQPMVVNPDVIAAKATFEIINITVEDNRLRWSTTKEAGILPFIVEQYRWNKWVQVGEVAGQGIPGQHHYEIPVRLHSGENRFRVRQTDSFNNRKLSPEVVITNNEPPVELISNKVSEQLVFTRSTLYEIYDIYGRIVFKGINDTVNIAGLNKGEYYLNFDNQMSFFLKK